MSLTLDLSRDDCRDLARRLVPISDVIMENYSARVMRNFGLDYPSVRPLNPAIVFISMPGYGMTGPHRNHVSYGTNIEPSAGLSNLIGYPGPKPYKSGEAYPDPNAGVNAVGANTGGALLPTPFGEGTVHRSFAERGGSQFDRGVGARVPVDRRAPGQDGQSPRLLRSTQRLQVQGRGQLGHHSRHERPGMGSLM